MDNPIVIVNSSNDDENGKSRKRTRNPNNHKILVEKMKVQKGLEHLSKSGKVIKAKEFQIQIECRCRRKCAENITAERQKQIFDTYYNFINWSQKTLYLRSLVKSTPPKENLNPIKTVRKRVIYKYYLSDQKGEHVDVCLQFILNCLCVTNHLLNRAIKSASTNANANELRGCFRNKITNQSDLHFLEKFIRQSPGYYSHYSASSSKRKYLNPNMNIMRLYKEYCLVCDFNERTTLSEWKFRHVFNTSFNLAFKPKKSDTCRKCDEFKCVIQSERTNSVKKRRFVGKKEDHLKIVMNTKKKFHECVDNAREDSTNTEVLTFDLQRALEIPSITTSEAYYRRKLYVYNLCIYDEVRRKAYMYTWNESIASRGSQEIFSCLNKHFSNFIPKDTKKIILYSDACPGQNRNIKMTLMLKKILNDWPNGQLQTIEQRFFVSGHSYNSCDSSFGIIERQRKSSEIVFIPQHWNNIISQAKKTEPKFTVVDMLTEDLFSCANLEKIIVNRKISINNNKINWLNIQTIINKRSNPFYLMIKNYTSSSAPVIKVSLGIQGASNTFTETSLVPLYTQIRPIAKVKYDDLQKMLRFIADNFHSFYKSLKFLETPRNKN